MKIVFVLAAILALASAKSVAKSSESEKLTIGKTLFTPYSIGSFTKAFAYHVADFLYYLILEAQKHDYTPEQFAAFLLKEEVPKDVAKYFADQYVYYKSLPTGTPAYDVVRYYFGQGIPMEAQKFIIEQYALFFQQFNKYLSKSEESSVVPKFTGVSSIVVEYFLHFLYPSDQQPTEQQPTKQYPTKQFPTKQYPTEQQPIKQSPTKQYPIKEFPTKQYPTELQPTKQYPTKSFPTTQYPTEQQPTQQYPTKQFPAKQVPSEEYPTKLYPSSYNPTSFEEKYTSAPFSQSYGFYNPYSSMEYQYGPYSQSYKPYSFAHSFEYTPYQYGSYGSYHDFESYKPYQYGHNQEVYPYGYPGPYATAA